MGNTRNACTPAMEDRVVCHICSAAPLKRCPCCGAPYCDAHPLTHEVCVDCAQALAKQSGLIKVALVGLLALVALVGATYAAMVDDSLISGLAIASACIPLVVILFELGERGSSRFLLTRRRRSRSVELDHGANVRPESSTVMRR